MKKFILSIFLLAHSFVFTMSDIAVVSLAVGDDYKERVKLGIENKKNYCKLHNYDFIYSEESQDTSRHVYWSKISFLLKIMNNSSYKWVFWIDADMLIMNLAQPLEDLIDENYNFIISRDWNALNTGVFLIRNNDWGRLLLQNVYKRTDCLSHQWPETQAITLEFDEKIEFGSMVKIIPQRLINSYAKEVIEPRYRSCVYQPGDFILHFAGVGNTEKLSQLFRHYHRRVINSRELPTLDQYLGVYGFKLSPLHTQVKEGYISEEQKQKFRELLSYYPDIQSVAEIGLNEGHSAEIFFRCLKKLKKLVSFDSNMHLYTPVAAEYFSKKNKGCFRFIQGNSVITVPKYATDFSKEKFDLIYIDGNHPYEHCFNDILNCKQLAHPNTVVWIDDFNEPAIQEAIADLRNKNVIEIENVYSTDGVAGKRCWVEIRYLFL